MWSSMAKRWTFCCEKRWDPFFDVTFHWRRCLMMMIWMFFFDKCGVLFLQKLVGFIYIYIYISIISDIIRIFVFIFMYYPLRVCVEWWKTCHLYILLVHSRPQGRLHVWDRSSAEVHFRKACWSCWRRLLDTSHSEELECAAVGVWIWMLVFRFGRKAVTMSWKWFQSACKSELNLLQAQFKKTHYYAWMHPLDSSDFSHLRIA